MFKTSKNSLNQNQINFMKDKVNLFKIKIIEKDEVFLNDPTLFIDSFHHIWIYFANIIEYYAKKNNLKYYGNIFLDNEPNFLSKTRIIKKFSKVLSDEELNKFSTLLDNINSLFYDAQAIIENMKLNFNLYNNELFYNEILKNINYLYKLNEFVIK